MGIFRKQKPNVSNEQVRVIVQEEIQTLPEGNVEVITVTNETDLNMIASPQVGVVYITKDTDKLFVFDEVSNTFKNVGQGGGTVVFDETDLVNGSFLQYDAILGKYKAKNTLDFGAFTGVSGGQPEPMTDEILVSINPSTLNLVAGSELTIQEFIVTTDKNTYTFGVIDFTSNNLAVLDTSTGTFKAVAQGSAVASKTFTTISGNQLTAQIPVAVAPQPKSLSFTGNTYSYLKTESLKTNIPNLNQFTIEMWVKPNATQTNKYLFSRGTNNDIAIIYGYVANQVELFSSNAAWRAGTQMTIPVGSWSHIAYVLKDGVVKGYVNGVEKISVAKAVTFSPSASNNVWVGSAGETLGNFNGKMDDFRFWGVGQLPQLGSVSPTSPGLLHYFKGDDNINDSAPNSETITFGGVSFSTDVHS